MSKVKDTLRIYFFGDSICFGQYVSPHLTWVHHLSRWVTDRIAERGMQCLVQNPSVNGNTTRMALERMPYDVLAHNPDVVLVQFGMNDCNYWRTDNGVPRVSPAEFEANLIDIVDRCFHAGARSVLLNTNHPTTRTQGEVYPGKGSYEESNRSYNAIIRSVAASYDGNVRLCDIEAVFRNAGGELAQYVLEDGLHLSVAGHRLYVEAVEPHLASLIDGVGID